MSEHGVAFVGGQAPPHRDTFKPSFRKPVVWPMPEDGEELVEHICMIKPEAPFDHVSLNVGATIDLHRQMLPREASLVKNQGKKYWPNLKILLLTKKQQAAIMERARLHKKKKSRSLGGGYVNVAEFITIMPKTEFSMDTYTAKPVIAEKQKEVVPDSNVVNAELLNRQSSGSKEKVTPENQKPGKGKR